MGSCMSMAYGFSSWHNLVWSKQQKTGLNDDDRVSWSGLFSCCEFLSITFHFLFACTNKFFSMLANCLEINLSRIVGEHYVQRVMEDVQILHIRDLMILPSWSVPKVVAVSVTSLQTNS